MPFSRTTRWLLLLLGIVTSLASGRAIGGEALWLLVDTAQAEARLMAGDRVIERFPDIATGRRGTKAIHVEGDDSTPLGEFRIDGIHRDSPFGIFLSLDYPTPAHAAAAVRQGLLTVADQQRILAAHAQGRSPPYDTPLGGRIGIHGIGKGSLSTHHAFNWTHGCIALDNAQIARLTARIRVGTRVVIR